MRSMVEGAATSAADGIRPLHRVPRSPPRSAGEESAAQQGHSHTMSVPEARVDRPGFSGLRFAPPENDEAGDRLLTECRSTVVIVGRSVASMAPRRASSAATRPASASKPPFATGVSRGCIAFLGLVAA